MTKLLHILVLLILISIQAYGIKPIRNYQFTPKDYHLKFNELKILTRDNFKINIWDIKADSTVESKANIVICGGDAGNMSYYLLHASNLAKSGYNVILFDYRGFGHSDDFKELDLNMLYHKEFIIDYEAVLDYTTKNHPNKKTGILTFSMGGIMPLLSKKEIDFYIGDCPLLIPNEVLKRINDPEVKTPIIQKYTYHFIPILIFLGIEDEIIKYDDSSMLKEYFSDITIVMFNGKHGEGLIKLKESYFSYIDVFLTSKNKK